MNVRKVIKVPKNFPFLRLDYCVAWSECGRRRVDRGKLQRLRRKVTWGGCRVGANFAALRVIDSF